MFSMVTFTVTKCILLFVAVCPMCFKQRLLAKLSASLAGLSPRIDKKSSQRHAQNVRFVTLCFPVAKRAPTDAGADDECVLCVLCGCVRCSRADIRGQLADGEIRISIYYWASWQASEFAFACVAGVCINICVYLYRATRCSVFEYEFRARDVYVAENLWLSFFVFDCSIRI